MKSVAVVGATGKVAAYAVEHCLEMGYQVKALARQPENITARHDNLITYQGDVVEPESLRPALSGVDIVLSCIGNRSKDKGVVVERGTKHIIDVMKEEGVERLALISSVGVGCSRNQLGKLGIRGYIFGALFYTLMNDQRKDLLGAENVALESGLSVVVVRPTELTQQSGVGSWTATDSKGTLGATISRSDVGLFLASLVENKEYDGKKVSLGGILG